MGRYENNRSKKLEEERKKNQALQAVAAAARKRNKSEIAAPSVADLSHGDQEVSPLRTRTAAPKRPKRSLTQHEQDKPAGKKRRVGDKKASTAYIDEDEDPVRRRKSPPPAASRLTGPRYLQPTIASQAKRTLSKPLPPKNALPKQPASAGRQKPVTRTAGVPTIVQPTIRKVSVAASKSAPGSKLKRGLNAVDILKKPRTGKKLLTQARLEKQAALKRKVDERIARQPQLAKKGADTDRAKAKKPDAADQDNRSKEIEQRSTVAVVHPQQSADIAAVPAPVLTPAADPLSFSIAPDHESTQLEITQPAQPALSDLSGGDCRPNRVTKTIKSYSVIAEGSLKRGPGNDEDLTAEHPAKKQKTRAVSSLVWTEGSELSLLASIRDVISRVLSTKRKRDAVDDVVVDGPVEKKLKSWDPVLVEAEGDLEDSKQPAIDTPASPALSTAPASTSEEVLNELETTAEPPKEAEGDSSLNTSFEEDKSSTLAPYAEDATPPTEDSLPPRSKAEDDLLNAETILENPKKDFAPVRLDNSQNFCFANSVLQCLIAIGSLDALRSACPNTTQTLTPSGAKSKKLTKAFRTKLTNVFSALWDENEVSDNPSMCIVPYLVEALETAQHKEVYLDDAEVGDSFDVEWRSLHVMQLALATSSPLNEQFDGRTPQDPAEYYSAIVNLLNNPMAMLTAFGAQDLCENDLRFRWQYESTCPECSKLSRYTDEGWTMDLDFPKGTDDRDILTLQSLVDHALTYESFLEGRECNHCLARRDTTTYRTGIKTLPRYLAVKINRAVSLNNLAGEDDVRKIHSHVSLPFSSTPGSSPENIKLSVLTAKDGPSPSSMEHEYEMVSVIKHHGKDTSRGHYTAFVKSEEGKSGVQWWHCNDMEISLADQAMVEGKPGKKYGGGSTAMVFLKRVS